MRNSKENPVNPKGLTVKTLENGITSIILVDESNISYSTIILYDKTGKVAFLDQQDEIENKTSQFNTTLPKGTYKGLINGALEIIVEIP